MCSNAEWLRSLFLFSHSTSRNLQLYLKKTNIFPQPGGHWGIASRLLGDEGLSLSLKLLFIIRKRQTATSLPWEFKGNKCSLLLWNLFNFRRRFGDALCPWRMRCFIMLSDQLFWSLGSNKSSVLHHIAFRYVTRWLSNKQSLMLQNCIATPECISWYNPLYILNFMPSNNLFLPEKLHS